LLQAQVSHGEVAEIQVIFALILGRTQAREAALTGDAFFVGLAHAL